MGSIVTENGEERVVLDQQGVWQHPCGTQLFFLNDDGTITCSRCNECLYSLRWSRTRLQ